jgi:hypothetical protein
VGSFVFVDREEVKEESGETVDVAGILGGPEEDSAEASSGAVQGQRGSEDSSR